jgi:Tfp pilus assembly protein PilF
VPRGRTLGALVAAATLALALLFVVLPVRAQRVDDSRAASAAALAQSAQTALQAGDLDGAERLLGEAVAADPRTPTLEAVRSRVIAARVVEQLEQRDRP